MGFAVPPCTWHALIPDGRGFPLRASLLAFGLERKSSFRTAARRLAAAASAARSVGKVRRQFRAGPQACKPRAGRALPLGVRGVQGGEPADVPPALAACRDGWRAGAREGDRGAWVPDASRSGRYCAGLAAGRWGFRGGVRRREDCAARRWFLTIGARQGWGRPGWEGRGGVDGLRDATRPEGALPCRPGRGAQWRRGARTGCASREMPGLGCDCCGRLAPRGPAPPAAGLHEPRPGRLESGCTGRSRREGFAVRSKLGFPASASRLDTAGTDKEARRTGRDFRRAREPSPETGAGSDPGQPRSKRGCGGGCPPSAARRRACLPAPGPISRGPGASGRGPPIYNCASASSGAAMQARDWTAPIAHHWPVRSVLP